MAIPAASIETVTTPKAGPTLPLAPNTRPNAVHVSAPLPSFHSLSYR